MEYLKVLPKILGSDADSNEPPKKSKEDCLKAVVTMQSKGIV